MTKRDLTIIGIVVAVAGVVVAILQLMKDGNGSVRTGANSGVINTGKMEGTVTVTGGVLDDRLRQKGEAYVALSASSCKDMHASMEAFTADTNMNPMDAITVVPPSLQMTPEVASYFGSAARDEIQARIDRLAKDWAGLNRLNMQRMVQGMLPPDMAARRKSKAVDDERATFADRKQKVIEQADSLCRYIQDLKPAH